ncbi:hypothetical protein DKX38_029387 [Salix brachista]|uniref:Carboxypeptidase n=1 Tax=Salix brachista TaxID=2182728 RepID=A0A5N5IZ59_9ROSI|nr:hypothetical protein DKX38_029387 [Salix brachista]
MAMDNRRFYSGILICVLLNFASSVEAAPTGSLITELPGFSGVFPSNHHSGQVNFPFIFFCFIVLLYPANCYITFDEKNLFYYFIVSERNPSKDPVVLWLNGGPGCSSFDGFVYEHGPFNFEEGKPNGSLPILHLNPYSWSKWFQLYPEFVNNPFYIAGESYAGIYVPTLSAEVVKGIKAAQNPIINFKGYLIGNGVSHTKFEGWSALVPFAHGMGLVSDDMFEEVERACKGNYQNLSGSCSISIDKIDQALSGLNIYGILDACYHDPTSDQHAERNTSSNLPISFQQLGATERPLKVRKRMFGRAWPLWAFEKDGNFPSWPELALQGSVPCVNDEVATAWLNDESVRKSIHAEPKSIAGPWEICSDRIEYRYGAGSMLPYHKNLTIQGYRALIYSGDHDMCVPFTGTQAWTRSLGYKIIDEWRSWVSNHQVAGYLQGYANNLTFLTIKLDQVQGIQFLNTNHERRWTSLVVGWMGRQYKKGGIE